MKKHFLVSLVALLSGSLFLNVSFADGATIKKDDPQIQSPTHSTVKPQETPQPVEQKPNISVPRTPQALRDDPWASKPVTGK